MPASVAHWKFVDASVVLIARVHNPSIINVDFLRKKKIIPLGWKVDAGSPLVSPLLAHVGFGKFQLEVNPEQFTLVEKAEQLTSKRFPDSDELYQCAKKYVETLPHIPHKAIGFNWTVHIDVRDSLDWFKRKFLTGKKWRGAEVFPSSFTFKMKADKSCICTMTTMPLSQDIIHVQSNFHFQFPADADGKTVERMIRILDNPWGYYRTLVNNLRLHFPEDTTR